MMKKKIKKILFFVILFIVVGMFFVVRFKSYDYEVNYNVNEFKVIESYSTESSEYKFIIKNSNKEFPYKFKNDYITTKELIESIKIYNNEDETCILPISNKISFYPICYKDNSLTYYNLSNTNVDNFKYQQIKNNIFDTDNIKVNNTNNNNYLLYNYTGFYYIANDKIKNIKLFEKDVYNIDLIYQLNEYLLIPNYNDNYYFTKLFVVNIKNGKVKEIKLEKEIAFDSIFLGDYKNKIYLLDKKEEKEYRINMNKLEVEEIEYTILKNNKLERVSFKEIANNNLLFDNKDEINYEIIDNKLYYIIDNYNILVTDKIVNKIIKQEGNTIYYLSQENLYMYNNTYGEVLLISNFEWNFNNTNMIYFYK